MNHQYARDYAPPLPPTLTLDSTTTLSQTGRISRPRAFVLRVDWN